MPRYSDEFDGFIEEYAVVSARFPKYLVDAIREHCEKSFSKKRVSDVLRIAVITYLYGEIEKKSLQETKDKLAESKDDEEKMSALHEILSSVTTIYTENDRLYQRIKKHEEIIREYQEIVNQLEATIQNIQKKRRKAMKQYNCTSGYESGLWAYNKIKRSLELNAEFQIKKEKHGFISKQKDQKDGKLKKK